MQGDADASCVCIDHPKTTVVHHGDIVGSEVHIGIWDESHVTDGGVSDAHEGGVVGDRGAGVGVARGVSRDVYGGVVTIGIGNVKDTQQRSTCTR